MAEPQPLKFTRQPDGSVTVDRWVPEILVSHELLASAEPGFLARHENNLRLQVANGDAIYRIADEGRDQEYLRAELLESRIFAPRVAAPALAEKLLDPTLPSQPGPGTIVGAITEIPATVPASAKAHVRPQSKSGPPKPLRKKGRK